MLTAENVSIAYQDKTIIRSVEICFPEKKVTVLIGANGCGKSTLLKSLAGHLPPQNGSIKLNRQDIYTYPRKKLARHIAILAQGVHSAENITVSQLVRYGRYPHHSLVSRWSGEDEKQVRKALAMTQTDELENTFLEKLSGGQRQRVWIAMALAQDTPYLFLDEPTTYLDLHYQIEILDLIRDLNRKQGKTVIMVLHDLNLAARYADHVVALKSGEVYAQGSPGQVLTGNTVEKVFNLSNLMIADPVYHTPMCIPIGRR